MERNTRLSPQKSGLPPKSEEGSFVFCPKCGKRLIERLPNGLWKFVFGSDKERKDSPPVYMLIHGNIKMKCLRRKCDQFIILNFFPFSVMTEEDFNKSDTPQSEPLQSP